MLPTLGKVLDKVVNKRLQYHLEKKGKITQDQFAYSQAMGTVDALIKYKERLDNNKRSHSVTGAL